MKIHLVTPRNPESFWTYDRILPSLGKSCIFPNLSMPTVAGLTGPEHEVTLCDENVEDIDFDVAADIVGTVVVDPTFANVVVLALIISIRTFLSFALEVEINGHWPWQRTALSNHHAAGGTP